MDYVLNHDQAVSGDRHSKFIWRVWQQHWCLHHFPFLVIHTLVKATIWSLWKLHCWGTSSPPVLQAMKFWSLIQTLVEQHLINADQRRLFGGYNRSSSKITTCVQGVRDFFVTWFSFSFFSCFVESIWCTIILTHSNHFTIFELMYCIFLNYLMNIFLYCRRRMLLLAVALICTTTKQLWVLTSLSLFRNDQIYVLMLIPIKYKSLCLCFNKLIIQMHYSETLIVCFWIHIFLDCLCVFIDLTGASIGTVMCFPGIYILAF